MRRPTHPLLLPARAAERALAAVLVPAALLAAAAGLPAQGTATPRARTVAALDAVARAPVARGDVGGLSVVVLRGRDTLLARGYGRADLAREVPMTVGHVLPIASLTKQVTAAAVLRLVEQRRVGLDDPVARHLADPAHRALVHDLARGRPVTVRQLLTHTAGLPDFADRPDPDSWGRPGGGAPVMLARVRGLPPDFAPGTALRYSNTGYVLLGLLLERYAGVPFAAHVTRTLFRPNAMPGAGYCGGRTGAAAPVPGYRRTPAGLEPVELLHPDVAHAAGGTHLCASALDLAAWNAALHGGRVLRPPSYAAMTTGAVVRRAPGDTLRARYGLGVALSALAGRRAVHHGGDVAGFAAYLAYLPDDSLSVVLLMNTEGPVQPAALAEQLVAAALGAPPAETPAPGGPSPAALGRLVGRYGDPGERTPAAFTMVGDGLAFVWEGGAPEPLRWVGGRTDANTVTHTLTNGPGRFTFAARPGAAPAVWADLTYVVFRWRRVGPPHRADGP